MALVFKDRVQETTTTSGTGTVTLAGAVPGYQAFSTIGDGNVTYYVIYDQNANQWEVGIGTYTLSGTTLSRTTVLSSSNGGSLVSFGSGTKYVWCDYPSSKVVIQDVNGNVGIGVEPSAWGNIFKVAQVGVGGAIVGRTTLYDQINVTANTYHDGSTGWRYIDSDNASRYEQLNGIHSWYNAPSGTAGNPITFTQAMTLDVSGNLGLGVTPSAWSAGRAFEINSGASGGFSLSGGYGQGFNMTANAYYNSGWLYGATATASRYAQDSGTHKWFIAPSGTAGNPITFTQGMVLDNAANLAVGPGTSPSAWNTGMDVVELKNGVSMASYSTDGRLYLTSNAYYDTGGTWRYKVTAAAALYGMEGGTHAWFVLPSGSAGAAQSWTAAMQLSNAGVFTVAGNRTMGINSADFSTASGTATGRTGIPTGVKRIQMVIQNMSVTSTVPPVIQLGTAAGYVATGYTGSDWYHSASGINGAATPTTGLEIVNSIAAATISHGIFTICNIAGTNNWVIDGHIEGNAGLGGGAAGYIALPGALDRVQLTGATFDGGSITITYE